MGCGKIGAAKKAALCGTIDPARSMSGEFTLSYHFYATKDKRNHFELFLDTDGKSALETWQHYGPLHDARSNGIRFQESNPHRREYLAFSGVISHGRGRLRILRRGRFSDCRRQKAKFIKVRL